MHHRLLTVGLAVALAGLFAPPAAGAWRLSGVSRVPAAYGQGVAVDPASGAWYFSGLIGASNIALYRTASNLRPTAVRANVLPRTREGYNHVGDIAYDRVARRVLLPLECYYPGAPGGANTCGLGAFAVADPRSLAFRYHVNLERAQIAKAMWAEVTPDARWVLTSSGRRLLAYRAAEVRLRAPSPIAGKDLGPLLSTSGVTGATFSAGRLFLSLNRGTYFQLVSYAVGRAPDGSPSVAGAARPEISLRRSGLNHEPEGLAATGRTLHWQIAGYRTFYTRILSYAPQ